MAGLFNVQCALHDLNCHAHARYLFKCLKESTSKYSGTYSVLVENCDQAILCKLKFVSSRGLNFVKFVKQISLLNRARYSAHFDTKRISIVIFLVPKRLRLSKPFL
ncbi:hypothetical protein T02_600 [Trichinella nativa]|uniref:Uncharacterized protein n=1 Tax=Trichinella nativa TaxID=6335 RepID=A0A0V1KR97_9BILA|nr:hypothetical protein T02_600 [Trichinella nativa]